MVARPTTATLVLGTLAVVAACRRPPASPAAPPPPHPAATTPAPCQILRDRLCQQFGAGSDVCELAAEQTQVFRPERCTSMLSRYEATAQGAHSYAEGKAALMARGQYTGHGPAPNLGNPDAAITLVIFSDFDDPESGRFAPLATAIKNLYADRVRLVFRQFPLATHANGHLAAEASLAAHAQGKFWALHDVMFGNPQDHGRAALEKYAKAAGLELKAFRRALDEKTFAADVDADLELGRKLGIQSVPSMFANGKQVSVPYGADELARLVEKTSTP